MSVAVFHYGAMQSSADEVRRAGDCMEDYADELSRKVSCKLEDYSGSRTGNVSQASDQIGKKIRQLTDRAAQLRSYEGKVDGLVAECKNADEAVKSTITRLTGEFKDRNNIKTSWVYEGIIRMTVGWNNKDARSRMDSGLERTFGDWLENLGDRFRQWYTYGGGKYLIWENTKAALKIAVGVISIAAALVSGAALIVVIAGVVAGAIATMNGLVDWNNNSRAAATAADDPVRAKRLSDIESVSGALRKSYDKGFHVLANVIDGVEMVAKIITLVSGIKELGTKGLNWIKQGNPMNNGVRADGLGTGWSARMTTFKNRMGDFFGDIKTGNWGAVGNTTRTYAKQFLNNVLKPFKDANTGLNGTNIKDGIEGLKFYATLGEDLTNDGFIKTIGGIGLTGFALGENDNMFTLGDAGENVSDFLEELKNGGDFLGNILDSKAGVATRRIYAHLPR